MNFNVRILCYLKSRNAALEKVLRIHVILHNKILFSRMVAYRPVELFEENK